MMLLSSLFGCKNEQSIEITEANYKKLDSIIWTEYDRQMEIIGECYEKHPNKKDSLIACQKNVYKISSEQNKALAIKFAAVPSGLQRVFMLRLDIPKERIDSVLKSIPDSLKANPYCNSIKMHLDNDQIIKGSNYYDFQAFYCDSTQFKISSLLGKQILFIYGGLGCMGEDGRNYLKELYGRTARDKFEIVVYWPCSDLSNLKDVSTHFETPYIIVSDLLLDESPVKIIYGAQSTPTCFIISDKGVIIEKFTGIRQDIIDAFVK